MSNRIHLGKRRAQRGVSLVEILIVVAIIALVSASVGLAAFKFFGPTQDKTAAANARAIRGAVKAWWLEHDPTLCPEVRQLVTDQILDKDQTGKDPWGKPWRIECAENDVTIYSDGRDRIAGTPDDIRIPPT